jgi:hypothetical protein
LNEIPLGFPRESKEFRRGLDLLRHGESKAQVSSINPWLKIKIAARGFEEKKGGGDGKEIDG